MDRVAALYRAHHHFVWRLVWRARVPAGDIEDVAHDVFLVVLRKPPTDVPSQDSPSTPDQERAQLFTITAYELKNYRSRARFRRTEPMDDRAKEIADARNDAARIDDRNQLLVLLDSTEAAGRAVFELVELEGFSVVDAARCLEITESVAHKRLAVARKDIEAAATKLAKRDQEAGKKRTSAFLLPFGVGAWLKLRDIQNPPEGTGDRLWQRLQDTMAAIERENDRPASTPLRQPPPRARLRGLSRLARSLKSPWGHFVSACLGGAVVALLFLLPTNARIAILRIPGPVILVTSATSATSATTETPLSPPVLPTAEARPATDAALAEELVLLRRARVAYAAGDIQATIAALNDYETRYPAGRLRQNVDTLRASLLDAGAR